MGVITRGFRKCTELMLSVPQITKFYFSFTDSLLRQLSRMRLCK